MYPRKQRKALKIPEARISEKRDWLLHWEKDTNKLRTHKEICKEEKHFAAHLNVLLQAKVSCYSYHISLSSFFTTLSVYCTWYGMKQASLLGLTLVSSIKTALNPSRTMEPIAKLYWNRARGSKAVSKGPTQYLSPYFIAYRQQSTAKKNRSPSLARTVAPATKSSLRGFERPFNVWERNACLRSRSVGKGENQPSVWVSVYKLRLCSKQHRLCATHFASNPVSSSDVPFCACEMHFLLISTLVYITTWASFLHIWIKWKNMDQSGIRWEGRHIASLSLSCLRSCFRCVL